MLYDKLISRLSFILIIATIQFTACQIGEDVDTYDTKHIKVRIGRYNNDGQLIIDTVLIDSTRITLLDNSNKQECILDSLVNGWEYFQSKPYYFQIFKINSKYKNCEAFAKFSKDTGLLSLSECELYATNTFKINFTIENTKIKKRFWTEYYVISDTTKNNSPIFKFSLGPYLNGVVDTSTFYFFKPCDSL